MKAQICPVCNGSGKYEGKECHGCDGKGWVSVSGDYPPYYPRPYIYPPCDPYLDRWITTTDTIMEEYTSV